MGKAAAIKGEVCVVALIIRLTRSPVITPSQPRVKTSASGTDPVWDRQSCRFTRRVKRLNMTLCSDLISRVVWSQLSVVHRDKSTQPRAAATIVPLGLHSPITSTHNCQKPHAPLLFAVLLLAPYPPQQHLPAKIPSIQRCAEEATADTCH